jgi:translation initiation factor IF-3
VKVISKALEKKINNLVNEEIQFEKVMVISDLGEQLGIMDCQSALKLAEERNLDLVCVAPQSKMPVCKFMDYSKYRYEQLKRAREALKNQKIITVKEVRLSPTIDVHDFETKMRNAFRFLSSGDKVKVNCRFRGRMIEQADKTKNLFFKFANGLEEVSVIEREPVLDGRNMFMILGPKPEKKK